MYVTVEQRNTDHSACFFLYTLEPLDKMEGCGMNIQRKMTKINGIL